MGTENQTIALAVYASGMTQEEINANLRVQFFKRDSLGLSSQPEAIPAVLCKDFFAKEIAEERRLNETGFYVTEFDSGDLTWICPNTTEITVLNDVAGTNTRGVDFEASVD